MFEYFRNKSLAAEITQALTWPTIEGYENNLPGILARVKDPNNRAFYKDGMSLLHRLIDAGYSEHAIGLLDRGADANATDVQSILWAAIKKQYKRAVDKLIEKNADVNYISRESGYSLLMHTLDNYNPIIFKALLVKVSQETLNHRAGAGKHLAGFSALKLAVVQENIDAVQALIDAGAKVNLKDFEGNTPLVHAAISGNTAIVRLLVNTTGCDVNARNYSDNAYQQTPLMRAIDDEDIEVAEVLLKAGANVNLQDSFGETALHYAIRRRNLDLANLLLTYNPDLNLKNSELKTAPELAASMAAGEKLHGVQIGEVEVTHSHVNTGSLEIFDLLNKPEHIALGNNVILQIAPRPNGLVLRTAFDFALGVGREVYAERDNMPLARQHPIEAFDPKLVAQAKAAAQKFTL